MKCRSFRSRTRILPTLRPTFPNSKLSRADMLAGLGAAALAGVAHPALAAAPGDLSEIARLLGVDRRYGGAGLRFDIGAVYPQTGAGAVYGAHLSDIPDLAFRHIAAMGGPKFNLILKDNRSGDPQAGVQAVRDLGFANVPMMLSSYAADLGAMLTGIKLYKILSLDGSGGTSIFAAGTSAASATRLRTTRHATSREPLSGSGSRRRVRSVRAISPPRSSRSSRATRIWSSAWCTARISATSSSSMR